MKKLALLSIALLCGFNLLADEAAVPAADQPAAPKTEATKKVSAKDAGKYIGETMTVTGKVAQVTIREKLVYVNVDGAYPNSPFTAVIFSRATNQFHDLHALNGKNVEITGKIDEYKDKPQIVLNSSNQLTVIEQKLDKK